MALNIPTAGGGFDRIPVVKYDARAGRLFRVDRSNASGQWVTDNVEITNGFQAVFDLENAEEGWLHFPQGAAPDIRTVKVGDPWPEKPSDKHRGGYRVRVLLGKQSGGDVREMASNAKAAIDGLNPLHDAYLAGVKDNPGKLPVVSLEKTVTVKSKARDEAGRDIESTNYQPVWKIERWIDRPALLGGEGQQQPDAPPATPPAPPPPPPPPAPPPPTPAAAQQPALAEGEEF